jgi:hypothetical protein
MIQRRYKKHTAMVPFGEVLRSYAIKVQLNHPCQLQNMLLGSL